MLRIGPLICSEDLSVKLAAEVANAGANLLVTIGSDAWLGDSTAPQQHLALAAIRAVETRRQLVRAMLNGVSAHIDARGRVLSQSSLVHVPRGEIGEPTLMVVEAALIEHPVLGPRISGYFAPACAGGLALLAICESAAQRRRRRPRRRGRRSSR